MRQVPGSIPLFLRIAAGSAVVLLVLLSIVVVALLRLADTAALFNRLSRSDAPALEAIEDLRVQLLNEQIALNRFDDSGAMKPGGDDSLLAPYFNAHNSIFGDLGVLRGFATTLNGASTATSLELLQSQIQAVEDRAAAGIAATRAGKTVDRAADYALIDATRQTSDVINDQVDSLIRTASADAQAYVNETNRLVTIASLLGAALALAAAIWVTMSISIPLARLTRAANRIAAGSEVEVPESDRRDEIGILARAFERMLLALRRRSDELQRSNADLEQFAYVASHDLQEPLRMVSSYTTLLKRRYGGKLGPDADEFIAFAVDGATRMQNMINDLLLYSRAGRTDTLVEPTDSQAAVERALANLQSAIADKGALVTVERLPVALANGSQLTRVFQNLIGNALKFCKAERPTVRVGAVPRGGDWEFSVADNGIGIEPQHRDRIFLIFQRLHRQSEYPGTGIGLAVCKRIIEREGGRIWFESSVGQGTTFFFTLPAVLATAAVGEAA
jgi:signal transduction histidine kinase